MIPSLPCSLRAAIVLSLLLVPAAALAASGDVIPPLAASIRGPDTMVVAHAVVLEANVGKPPAGAVTYTWYQEPVSRPIGTSSQVFFAPKEPGTYTVRLVVRATMSGETLEVTTTKSIGAYKRKIALIADDSLTQEQLASYRQSAADASVLLQVIRATPSAVALTSQEALAQAVSDQFDALADSEAIVLWTDPAAGMQALMRAVRSDASRADPLQQQSIIVVSDGSLPTLARSLRGPFSVVKPLKMYLTRREAVPILLSSATMPDFEQQIATRGVEIAVQDASILSPKPWNLLTVIVTFLLTHGVASQTVILLLLLPIIATILSFLKQVVGLTTFGLYTPSIIALSFLSLGWMVGLAFLLVIVAVSYGMRMLMRRWRILYVPKMAIILIAVSFGVLVLIAIGASLSIVLAPDTIFILLIMSTLSESLLATKIEEGWQSAMQGIAETIIAALLCVLVVQWSALQSFVLAYPEAVLLTIIINVCIGRYTGLRLSEYFRFREIFTHLQEE